MPASDIEERPKSGIVFPMEFQGNRVSTFDAVEKKRIWRTLDIHILPWVTLLHLMSFL
jgi:hypothetical protein